MKTGYQYTLLTSFVIFIVVIEAWQISVQAVDKVNHAGELPWKSVVTLWHGEFYLRIKSTNARSAVGRCRRPE